jgi:hypothetical protein
MLELVKRSLRGSLRPAVPGRIMGGSRILARIDLYDRIDILNRL